MFRLALVLSLFCACVPVRGYVPLLMDGGTRRLDFHFDVRRVALPNGLVAALLPDPKATIVSVDMRYTIGSGAEPRDKGGLAHLVEHVAFTLQPSAGALDARLKKHALSYNASTHKLYTHYRSSSFVEQLPALLAVEADRLHPTCASISEEMVTREHEVVRNEIRLRQSQTRAIVSTITEQVFDDAHPLSHDVGGTEDSVSKVTRADVCAFMLRHYVPANALLVVSGPVDASTLTLITNTFATPAIAPATLTPMPRAKLVGTMNRAALSVEHPGVTLTFAAPQLGGKDDVATRMLAYGLDRVSDQMYLEDYIVRSDFHWLEDEALWIFDLKVTEKDNQQKALEALFREIERLQEQLDAAATLNDMSEEAVLFRNVRS